MKEIIMTINNATVEQINVALLDIDKRIKALNADSETIKSLQNNVKTIKSSLNETKAGLTSGETYDINISGTAEHAKIATKVSHALTVNGKTYDGSEAVDAGVQTVENGGTSATNAEDGFNTLADGVRDSSTPADDEKMLLKPTGTWYKTTCLDFWHYIKGKISSVLGLTKDNYGGNANTATKAVEVVDYGDTSRTVKIGFAGPNVTANKLSYLAGYTEDNGSSVKLKNVKREELVKWLGLPMIRYADYRTENFTFTALTDQKKIDLSYFGPDVKEDNVLSFMVIYYSKIPVIAQADGAKSQGTGSSGLKCVLYPAGDAGTGYCVVRCVYLDIPYSTIH